MVGTAGNDTIAATRGQDVIYGDLGADTIYSSSDSFALTPFVAVLALTPSQAPAFNDKINGGDGNDVVGWRRPPRRSPRCLGAHLRRVRDEFGRSRDDRVEGGDSGGAATMAGSSSRIQKVA
jgi:Ca2+-binding RTX toxin-like protein